MYILSLSQQNLMFTPCHLWWVRWEDTLGSGREHHWQAHVPRMKDHMPRAHSGETGAGICHLGLVVSPLILQCANRWSAGLGLC